MTLGSPPGKESLKRIRQVLRSCPEYFLEPLSESLHVLDIHGFVVDTSAWFPQCLGYEHAEMEGLHVSSFDVRWSLSELSDIVQRIASLPPGETAVVETVYRRTDGVLIPVRLNTRSLKVGDELFLFRSTQDLSRGSISESRFRQLSRLNILLATSGAAVFEARDEATFLQAFCDLVVRHGEMSLAWVGRPGSDGLFRVQAAAGMRAYLEDIRISVNEGVPEGDGPVGAAFRQNRPFFNNDFDAPFLRPWKDRARSLGIRSNAVFPIWHEDQVWGIFAVYHDDREAFPEEVQASLFELSRTLTRGLALVATRRKEKETALLQEALLENTLAAIALVREESFVSGNARFHEMFGMRNDTLPRCSPNDLFVDERAARAICRPFEGSSDQEVRLFSDILVRKLDGREFHVDLSARHLAGTQTTVWTVVDVSERHALQEKNIRLSQFNLMLARANQAIATFSEEHALLKELCILAVETGGMDLAGIGVPDANGWLEIRASAGKESFLEGVRYSVREEALEGRGSVGLAWRTRTSQFAESFSPTSFWKERARQFGFRSGGALPVLRNGKPWGVFFVYYRKEKILLTEFKDILEELVSNVSRGLDLFELQGFHSLLSRALAVVSDGAVITGKDQKVCFSNRAFSEISGFPLEEVIGQDCRKLSGHSRDPRGVGEVDRAIESGQPFEGEVLSYRKDGTPFWNHLSITPIKNESGVLTHFLEIHRDVTHVRQMAERLAFESRHDELTGLPNRRSLESHLERVLARAGRHGQTVAVGVLDLNNFKPVNDLHGHEAGDVLLKEFSWRVRTKLRESDFIARLGGDEFVLVIDDLLRPVSEETLGTFLERIHEVVETPFLLPSGKSAMVGMSLGIALFPEDGREGNELLRKADFSMYRVKDRKRRQISWWQRGAEEDRAETEHPIDPFGPETIALLSEHKEELERFQEGFVESFYRELEESPDARSVLGALSQEERASLKLRQGQYLKGLLIPEIAIDHRREQSCQLGEIHALTGVPDYLLLRSKFLYSRLLVEHLNRSLLAPRDRLHLYLALEVRLERDFEVQIDASKSTIDQYFSILQTEWAAIGQDSGIPEELSRVAGLPGIMGVSFLGFKEGRPQESVNAAGRCERLLDRLMDLEDKEPPKDRKSFLQEFENVWSTGKSRSLGAVMSMEDPLSVKELFCEHSVRSMLVIPVTAGPGASGVIVLFGRYPSQFESGWIERFAMGFRRRWSRRHPEARDVDRSPYKT